MFNVVPLGLSPYKDALSLQRDLVEKRLLSEVSDTILIVEHPPVITMGRAASESNLLLSREELGILGVEVVDIDRGGDVTYHGPGQLVVYPILDLTNYKQDLHWYLRTLEEVIIQTIAEFGVAGRRFPPHTGVWVGEGKIAAIGIKVRKWVTSHGLALNVNPDMRHFNWIVPCGIREYGVTSMEKVLTIAPAMGEVAEVMSAKFESVFRATGH